MYIFPNLSSINASTQPQTTDQLKKTVSSDEQQKQNQNVTTQKTVSIFSNYDTNQDKYVKYNEGKSLFEARTFDNTFAGNADYSVFGDNVDAGKAAVRSMAQGKMGGSLSKAFESVLSKFSSKTGSEKYQYNANDESTANTDIAARSKALDKIASDDAKTFGDTAFNKVWGQYTKELDSAFAEYSQYTEEQKKDANNKAATAKNTDKSSVQEVDTKNGNSKVVKTKTTTESSETGAADDADKTSDETKETADSDEVNVSEKTKTEKTVYATLDTDTSKRVSGTENTSLGAKVTAAQNNLNSMTPAHLDKDSKVNNIQAGLRAMASGNYDAVSMYQSILSSFDVSTGSKTVEVKEGEESKAQQKLDDAQKKMDTKVTNAETKAEKEITKVTENYAKALDAALKQYETTDSKTQESLLENALSKQAKSSEEESKSETEGSTDEGKSSKTSGTVTETGSGTTGTGSTSSVASKITDSLSSAAATTASSLTSSSSSKSSSTATTGTTKVSFTEGQSFKRIAKNYDGVSAGDIMKAAGEQDMLAYSTADLRGHEDEFQFLRNKAIQDGEITV